MPARPQATSLTAEAKVFRSDASGHAAHSQSALTSVNRPLACPDKVDPHSAYRIAIRPSCPGSVAAGQAIHAPPPRGRRLAC